MKKLYGLLKVIILLCISLGLFWFAEEFSPVTLFEPQSTGWIFWVSYARDLILPFAFYFFICLGERWLKTWQARALVALTVPALLEFGQYLYYQIAPTRYVGSFDPIDILMYGISVGSAVLVEQMILARRFDFWSQDRASFEGLL